MKYIMIVTTCASREEAQAIGQSLLESKLVACVNIVDGISSRFWWKSSIDTAEEILVVTKTEENQFARVAAIIKQNHSYEVPEILAIPIVRGDEKYLQWLSESITKEG